MTTVSRISFAPSSASPFVDAFVEGSCVDVAQRIVESHAEAKGFTISMRNCDGVAVSCCIFDRTRTVIACVESARLLGWPHRDLPRTTPDIRAYFT